MVFWSKEFTQDFAVRPTFAITGRRLNGFLGLSFKERTILFLLIFLDKTVFALGRSPNKDGRRLGVFAVHLSLARQWESLALWNGPPPGLRLYSMNFHRPPDQGSWQMSVQRCRTIDCRLLPIWQRSRKNAGKMSFPCRWTTLERMIPNAKG